MVITKPERRAKRPETDLSEELKGLIFIGEKNGLEIVPINVKMCVVTTAS